MQIDFVLVHADVSRSKLSWIAVEEKILVFTCLPTMTRFDTRSVSCGAPERVLPDQVQKLHSPRKHRLRWHWYCYRSLSLVQRGGIASGSCSPGPDIP